MQQFQSPVPTAVAYPATVFFVPPIAFGGNLVVNVVLFLMIGAFTSYPPFIAFIPFIAGMVVMIAVTFKNPHFLTINQARMQRPKWAKKSLMSSAPNIVKSEGRKYVP